MATIDQQFVEYIVKTLVSNPDDVRIDRSIDEKGVLLALTVNPEDVGRVIGRRGATAQSIRTLLRALGTKNDARYNLKIMNTDDEREVDHSDRSAEATNTPEPMTGDGTEASYDAPEEIAEAEEPVEEEDESTSDLAKKTREELADLDDLDI